MIKLSRTYRPSLWARLFRVDSWKLVLDRSDTNHIKLGDARITCMGVSAVEVSKALLWHSVTMRTETRQDTLTGLSRDSAHRLCSDLIGFVNAHLSSMVESSMDELKLIDRVISSIVRGKRQYLAQSDIGRAIASVPGKASQALSHPLFDANLIPTALRKRLPPSFKILTDTDERGSYNESFLLHEMRAFEKFFDDVGGLALSEEQREACIRLEDNNLLVASAGSGKSATMVSKVAYVLEKAIHSPGEILVLAFNKSAANELKHRIANQLGVPAEKLECRVTTFHALGLGIIKEIERKPPQLANWVENAAGEAKFVSEIIRELTEADSEFRSMWLDLLSLYPRADIPRSQFATAEDYGRYISDSNGRGGSSIETLAGVYVISLQEKSIVNWLWRNSVEFEYERQIETADEDGSIRYLKPDFYYSASNTIHEHFAINADGTSPFPNYVEHTRLKRGSYARLEVDFFETLSAQASDGSLLQRLQGELEKRQIQMVEKPYDEVLKAIAPVVATHYHKIIGVCIKHIRASRLTLDMLLEKAKTLQDQNRAQLFSKVVCRITETYSAKLEAAHRIDFDSMIGDAVKLVETSQYRSPYSLILLDEFQDISEPRANLIKALKHQKPFTKVFAVGDDWQSIYRFTGSDITIFTQFEANFGPSWQGRLERTYRCNQMLAETAARFIQRNPSQLSKTVKSSRPAIPGSIRAIPVRIERFKPSLRDACFAVLQRLDAFLGNNPAQWRFEANARLKVLVLWRYNLLDPFHGSPPEFKNIDVSGFSFHRSKGMEADYTILLDVSEGDYGVPSRIEDDELLNLVIPRPETFQYAEERRLFYVALTRASRGTFLLYNDSNPSRYISELCDIAGANVRFETVKGKRLHQCPSCVTGRLVMRTGTDGAQVVGCSSFPRCEYTQDATARPSTSPVAS